MFYSQKTLLKLIESKRIKITPFDSKYLGSVSYEMHLGKTIIRVSPASKSFDGSKPKEKVLEEIDIDKEGFIIEPKQFIIAKTIESLYCDKDIMGIFDGKASLAQIGLFTNISSTLIEPLINSTITCEIFNSSNYPVTLYSNQKIGQVFFSNLG